MWPVLSPLFEATVLEDKTEELPTGYFVNCDVLVREWMPRMCLSQMTRMWWPKLFSHRHFDRKLSSWPMIALLRVIQGSIRHMTICCTVFSGQDWRWMCGNTVKHAVSGCWTKPHYPTVSAISYSSDWWATWMCTCGLCGTISLDKIWTQVSSYKDVICYAVPWVQETKKINKIKLQEKKD